MPHSPIAAVMVHVVDTEQGLAWYQRAFPFAVRSVAPGTDFEFLQVGDVQIEVVPADEKVSSGAAGSVVYWRVPDLGEALRHFSSLGATLYRGPMQIEAGQSTCQVKGSLGQLHRPARSLFEEWRPRLKPFTTIAVVVFSLVAVLQLLRLILGWEVTVNGAVIPLWASGIAVAVAATLALMLWREARQ